MLPRQQRNRRNRRNNLPGQLAPGTAADCTVSLDTGKMKVVFSVPVVVSGIPSTFTSLGVSPTAVTVDSPTQIRLTFTTPPSSGGAWAIAAGDPAVRSYSGGYAAAAAGTF